MHARPDALPGLIVTARTPEQLEHALMILFGDAPPIVGDVYRDFVAGRNGGAYVSATRDPSTGILQRCQRGCRICGERQPVLSRRWDIELKLIVPFASET